MRCLGIDYGEKRIGLSYGDEIGVATPLPALNQATLSDRMDMLLARIEERKITDLVFGYPYNMDGSIGFKAKEVDAFIETVLSKAPLPVHRVDERLTSHCAKQSMGLRGRDDALRRSGKIDSASATIILQDYLDQRLPSLSSETDFEEDI